MTQLTITREGSLDWKLTLSNQSRYFLQVTLPHYVRYVLPYHVAYARYVLKHKHLPNLG